MLFKKTHPIFVISRQPYLLVDDIETKVISLSLKYFIMNYYMKKTVLLVISLMVCTVILAQDEKKEGDAMLSVSNYSGAAMMYRLCMEEDDECMLKLIRLLHENKVEAQFSDELFQLLSQLAKKGNAEAQYLLGTMYETGAGINIDLQVALRWYQLSAAQGYEKAKNRYEALAFPPAMEPTPTPDKPAEPQNPPVAQNPPTEQNKPVTPVEQNKPVPPVEQNKPVTPFTPDKPVVQKTPKEPKAPKPPKAQNRTYPAPYPVERQRQMTSVQKEPVNTTNLLLYAGGGVSIVGGVAASLFLTKPITQEKDGKIREGKRYNLGFAAAGLVIGGACIWTGIHLKKKNSTGYKIYGFGDDTPPRMNRDYGQRLNIVASGNEMGLQFAF